MFGFGKIIDAIKENTGKTREMSDNLVYEIQRCGQKLDRIASALESINDRSKKIEAAIEKECELICDHICDHIDDNTDRLFEIMDRLDGKDSLKEEDHDIIYYTEMLQKGVEAHNKIHEIMENEEPTAENLAEISKLMKTVEDVHAMMETEGYKKVRKEAEEHLNDIIGDEFKKIISKNSSNNAEGFASMLKEVLGDKDINVVEIKAKSPSEAIKKLREILDKQNEEE